MLWMGYSFIIIPQQCARIYVRTNVSQPIPSHIEQLPVELCGRRGEDAISIPWKGSLKKPQPLSWLHRLSHGWLCLSGAACHLHHQND